ncbi:MAG TPA: hypothetical protein VM263_11495 [Acidimicrobiales bacterium]|nr:hypothetical protein [Acidimicrobiales bacterium]
MALSPGMADVEGYAARVYRRSPVPVQNVLTTAFGVRERALRYGGRFPQYARELSESQWWPAEDLRRAQDRRLCDLVEFCVSRVPYYRDLFARLGLAGDAIRTVAHLDRLPLLDKETVRAEPERFVPEPPPERLIPSTTGGTTGTPLRYFVTPSAIQFNYATYETRFRAWAGASFGQRLASINGQVVVPISQEGPPFWRRNLAFNQLYLSAYHLSPANLPAYVDRLRRFDPEVVVGYVSTVHALARHLLDRGLVGAVRPRAVMVSSETLFPWLRADIEAAFGCRAFDGYSLGELTAFISECPSGVLHVSPEYGVVELVDVGGETEIVATGLFNRGMPLLRYRTGDRVETGPEEPCPCGRQLPRTGPIVGRVDEWVTLPDGRRIGPAALSLAFQAIRGLRQAQVVQDSPARLTVRLATAPPFGPEEERQLRVELERRLGAGLTLGFERVDEIPRTPAGKHRLIVHRLGSGGHEH